MSREIARDAEKRLGHLADAAAEQFDNTLLYNRVHEQVDGQHTTDHPLAAWLDATERAYDLSERDDIQDPAAERAFSAAEALNRGIDDLVDEQVARACATIVQEADTWGDVWDDRDIADAKHEARDWLKAHVEAAERAGVLEGVRQ